MLDERLMEMNFGDWELKNWEFTRRFHPMDD
jgi:hypothetical protein